MYHRRLGFPVPIHFGLFDTLDNPHIPINGIAQYSECFPIRRTIMRSDRLCDAVELNQNSALAKAALIDLCRDPAREEAPASALKCGNRESGISSESFRVVNRTVCSNPVRFGHGKKTAMVVEEDWAYSGSATDPRVWLQRCPGPPNECNRRAVPTLAKLKAETGASG